MKKLLQGILVVSSIALVAAGCNKTDDSSNIPANNSAVNTEAESNSNMAANTNLNTQVNTAVSTKTFTVEGDNFKFSPSQIKVKQGDTVVINFKNTGGFHDWVLDEFNAATKQLGDGATESITFVASKKGTFEYYCSVGQHRQMGMKGNLIVE